MKKPSIVNIPSDYTLKEIKSRIIKEFLNLIIILEMEKRETLSGYDVIDIVKEKFDETISPGTAYSTLYSIERKGLIYGETEGRKTSYKLTQKGKAAASVVKNSQKELAEIWIKIYN